MWQEISCGLASPSLHVRLWLMAKCVAALIHIQCLSDQRRETWGGGRNVLKHGNLWPSLSWVNEDIRYIDLISSYGQTASGNHRAQSWQPENSKINQLQRPSIAHSLSSVCVCMRGYMSSSVCRCLCACSWPNLLAAEIAVLSGGKLWLWTGLTSSWLHCPLQQAPTSTEYSCALKDLAAGKKGQETSCCVFQLMYLVSLQLCVSMHLLVCAHLFDDLWYKYMHVLASLHLCWPWTNWRASLVEGSGRCGHSSFLSCAISSADREQ